MLKLLIVEGNTLEGRDLAEKAGSLTQSNLYEKTIRLFMIMIPRSPARLIS